MDRSWEIDVDSLVERPVRAARMLLAGSFAPPGEELQPYEDARVVVLDADSDEFVLVPRLSKGLWRSQYMSLSDDGTQMIGTAYVNELFVYTLATGETQWLNRPEIDDHIMGTLSPDGWHVAALAVIDPHVSLVDGDELISVEIIGLDTGEVWSVWSGRGSWSECALGWSPDGRLLAASYQGHEDVLNTTIVIEVATGRILVSLEDRIPLDSPHAVWIGNDELAAFPEVDNAIIVVSIDIDTGRIQEQHLPRSKGGGYRGIGIGRYLRSPKASKERNVTELYTTELDGSDPRPLLSIYPRTGIRAVHMLVPII